jgi:hypothetical protein
MAELLGQGTEKVSFPDTSELRAMAEVAPAPEAEPRQTGVKTYEVLSNYALQRVHGAPEQVLIPHFETDRPVTTAADKKTVNDSLAWFQEQLNEIKAEDDTNSAEKAFRLWMLFEDMRSTNLVVPKWIIKVDGPSTEAARKKQNVKLAAGKISKYQFNYRVDQTRVLEGTYYRNDEGIPISVKNAPSLYEGLTPEAKKLYMDIKNTLGQEKKLIGDHGRRIMSPMTRDVLAKRRCPPQLKDCLKRIRTT